MNKDSEAFRAYVAALQGLYIAAGRPSTRKLATQLGASHTTVYAALNGHRRPKWPMVASIVQALGGSEATFRKLWAAAVNQAGLTQQELEERGLLSDQPPSDLAEENQRLRRALVVALQAIATALDAATSTGDAEEGQ